MARVAVAYVEVRPDLSSFAGQLKAALAKVNETLKVKIEPDTKGLSAAAKSPAVKRVGAQIGKEMGEEVGKKAGLTTSRAMAEYIKAGAADVRAVMTARMKSAARQAAVEWRLNFGARQLIDDAELDRIVAKLTDAYGAAGHQAGEAMVREHNTSVRKLLAADQRAAEQMQRQTSDAAKLRGRYAAEDFAEAYAQRFAASMKAITTAEIREFETTMVDKFGAVGSTVARAMVIRLDRDLKKRMKAAADSGAAAFLRRMAGRFGGGTVGKVFQIALRGVAGTMDTVGKVATKAFSSITSGLTSMGGPLGQVGQMLGKFTTTAGEGASQLGAMVGALGGVGLAAALVAGGMVILNTILGATLAVVIPLVGGLTALVSQLVALGSVGVGAIGLLPGAFAAAAAAFGPLMLVADRFEKLFEDTADHTGELFVALERLKNAIWAVLGTGFVQQVQAFVSGPLVQLLGGIERISTAWGGLLTELVKLAGSAQGMRFLNEMLTRGALLVEFFAEQVRIVAPALMTMATAAGPALALILDVVGGLVRQFADWVAQMQASGQLGKFFDQVAVVLTQIAAILPDVVGLMGTWITSIIGPAAQFAGLLGAMVERWLALASSPEGAAMITNFFLSMNRIVAAFEPLLEQVVMSFLQFGPTLASLTTTALPVLQTLLSTFMTLATSVGPAVQQFLGQFNTVLSDPAVQAAIGRLGEAFGELLKATTANVPVMTSMIDNLALLMRAFAPLMEMLMSVASVSMPLFATVLGIIAVGLQAVAALLRPMLSLLEKLGGLLTSWVAPAFDAVSDAIEFVRENIAEIARAMTNLPGPLGKVVGALGWVADKMGIVGGDAKTMATNTKNAGNSMTGSLTAVANSRSWEQIAANSQAVGEYMINMANNGIKGNNALIKSMAAMGAAAYAAKNERDILTFEKQVTRAYTRPTAQLYAQTVYASKTYAKIGTVAGTSFTDAYNQTVSTKLKTDKDAKAKAKAAGKKTAAGYLSTLIPALGQLDAFTLIKGNRAFDTGREIAAYIAKGITSGSKNIAKVTSYIQKNFGAKLSQMVATNKGFWKTAGAISKALPGFAAAMKKFTSVDQLNAYLNKQKDIYAQHLQNIKQFKANVINALTEGADLVGYFGFLPTPAEVQARLNAQLAQVKDFTSKLADLQRRGLSKELAAAWLQAGYDQAGNLVQGLQSATTAELQTISNTYKAIGTTAETAAEAGAVRYFGIGEQTVKGYIDGINSMQKAATTAMTNLMKSVYAAVKKKLGISSPSKLFEGVGVDTIAGYIEGVTAMQSDTVATIGNLYDAVAGVPPATLTAPTLPVQRPRYATTGALTQPPAPAPQFDVRVFVGDRELRDLVRVEVNEVDTRRARALVTGRRGG